MMMVDEVADRLTAEDLRTIWPALSDDERVAAFALLEREDAIDFFLGLTGLDQATIILGYPTNERRLWIRLLAPDDAADVLQEVTLEERAVLMELLDEPTRREVNVLLAYAEDSAGGLMNPRYARMRPEMTVDEAISYLRLQARKHLETIYYAYVLDEQQRLLGIVSFRELFGAPGDKRVRDVMETDLVVAPEAMDQEALARLFAEHDLLAIPVVDDQGRVQGIVTVDDIVDVVQEEATEDIHKLGGMAALESPYLQTDFFLVIRKRVGWLSILFIGGMLTASVMEHFEQELSRAVVLTVFLPLIIASGGNSGSQASTLVIRAMALDQVRLRDWWRVFRREVFSGVGLGVILAVIGVVRVLLWEVAFDAYGDHALRLGLTVGVSLVGVVLLGTMTGSMLPFILRVMRFDPASASAPFVSTTVDAAGLIIYLTVAKLILTGTLL
jgi:magnesium transporter